MPVVVAFVLYFLKILSEAVPKGGHVELGLCPGAPLSLRYDVGHPGGGHIQFYLAPRIDE